MRCATRSGARTCRSRPSAAKVSAPSVGARASSAGPSRCCNRTIRPATDRYPRPAMVRIRDTLLRDTVELTPRAPGQLSMYVCGPTVYDTPHIGNARTAVAFDAIRRYLEWSGFDVTFVSNVTDVEDKIIARAAREGRSEPEVASEFEAVYFDHMHRLNVQDADHRPHATEYIDGMLDLIGELVDGGHAYEVAGQ